MFNYDAPSISIWHHEWLMCRYPGRGKRYNFTIFELDKFFDAGINNLNFLDGVFVCSKWAKGIVEENGIKTPVYVTPIGVDNRLFSTNYKKLDRNDGITKFIHCGKWEIRKSSIEVLECFEKAFSQNDNVELHLITGNRLMDYNTPGESDKWKDLFRSSVLADKIKIYDWIENEDNVYQIFRECDCGVYLNKAEGFNLPLIENLAVGLQVIALNYSAHTEYISSDNALLVEPTELELAYDGCWFDGRSGGRWASIGSDQKEECVNHMRYIHKRKQSGDNLFNQAGVETAKKFTWKNTAETLLRVIQ
jgi:glycosyltransferase involved in cell wall biosynthesis